MPETEEMPAGLAERLQVLADTRTAGSRPWPGVDRAIQRANRRRTAGLSAVTAVGVLLAGATYESLMAPTTRSQPVAGPDQPVAGPTQPMLREGLAQLRAAGYGDPTTGSLAGNREWLAQVRERARSLVARLPSEPGSGRAVLASADLLMPWTGELGGSRYALVAYPTGSVTNGSDRPGPSFTAAVLTGGEADRMTILDVLSWSEQNPDRVETAQQFLLPTGDPADDRRRVALVIGPGVTGVKVASGRSFTADGELRTSWRPLRAEGVTWVGELTAAETYMSDVQLEGVGSWASSGRDSVPQVVARFRAIAAAGTDRPALDCASEGTNGLGGSIADQPVLALTADVKAERTDLIAAAAVRAPDGTWLLNFCRSTRQNGRLGVAGSGGGAIIRDGGDPDTFMAAIQDVNSADADGDVGYLVVVPAGATTATLGDQKVEVRNRLALFPKDDDGRAGATVRALDRDGRVIGTVQAIAATAPRR